MDQSAAGVSPRAFKVTNREVLGIAVPMTLAYLTTPLIGITDTAVVGQLNDAVLLGGLAVGAITFDVVFGTFNSLRSGTTGLVAQALGRGDRKEEAAVLLRALALALVIGFALVLLTPVIIATATYLINPAPDVATAMAVYVGIRMLAAPLTLTNYAALGYILGRGEGKLALVLQIVINGVNIALSVILGLKLGWGIEGVAWGTVAGEAAGLIVGGSFLIRKLRAETIEWSRVLDLSAMKEMLALNRDIMIRSFALLAAFALFTRQGAQLGTITLAANAILMNFFLLAGYFLDGFATAAEQLAGRAVGARHQAAFKRAVALSSIWGFVLAFLLAAIFLIFGRTFIELLTNAEEVRKAAIAFLPWAALTGVSGVLAFQMDGVYIGATWSRDMRNMMLLSLAVYAASMFALDGTLGNAALWLSLHVFLIARGLSLLALLPSRTARTFQ
ncbi:MATE family efflux transporter [Nitratireductor aestuarii]|uniref:MATE family efflux transporter n=1 Tax=Nitratireductor aestuarii TaxID=1735103 RepID=A0A916W7Q5_9HYPH|nr:MATE family efflux transporter [Nitratireductor aestuarii]GGA73703.1 MATE family efflux transporter [Nitratireductor aestuarii]